MSSELTGLFERTMPKDEVILRNMTAAMQRSELPARGGSADQGARTTLLWLGACAAAFMLVAVARVLTSSAGWGHATIQVEAETIQQANHRVLVPSTDPTPAPDSEPKPAQEPADPLHPTAHPRPTDEPQMEVSTASSARAEGTPAASWEAAAHALRTGNQNEAERILAELSTSMDPEVRDSAKLVQLRAAFQANTRSEKQGGLSAAQRTQLKTLVETGATASIRASARRLAQEVDLDTPLRPHATTLQEVP